MVNHDIECGSNSKQTARIKVDFVNFQNYWE